MILEIDDRAVLYSGQIVLTDEEESFRLKMEDEGIILDVRFLGNATQLPAVSPRFSEGVFKIDLINFGSDLGMATSGRIRAQTASGQVRYRNGTIRSGTWMLQYALTVHTIGNEKPNRLVNITISEKRVA
ncbi:hypothetical protein ABIA16_001776 [Sinorhizobium fredii]